MRLFMKFFFQIPFFYLEMHFGRNHYHLYVFSFSAQKSRHKVSEFQVVQDSSESIQLQNERFQQLFNQSARQSNFGNGTFR
jgi:hypothetical protein